MKSKRQSRKGNGTEPPAETAAAPVSPGSDVEKKLRNIETRTRAKYPEHDFQLFVLAASLLLSGGNRDFRQNAKDALKQLDACRTEAEMRRKLCQAEIQGSRRNVSVPKHTTFLEGVKFITGVARTDRAEGNFKKFYPHMLRSSRAVAEQCSLDKVPVPSDPDLAAKLEYYKDNGFSSGSLREGQRLYAGWKKGQPQKSKKSV